MLNINSMYLNFKVNQLNPRRREGHLLMLKVSCKIDKEVMTTASFII